jgi:hypothetical protein
MITRKLSFLPRESLSTNASSVNAETVGVAVGRAGSILSHEHRINTLIAVGAAPSGEEGGRNSFEVLICRETLNSGNHNELGHF